LLKLYYNYFSKKKKKINENTQDYLLYFNDLSSTFIKAKKNLGHVLILDPHTAEDQMIYMIEHYEHRYGEKDVSRDQSIKTT
jgi:uncharacterized protein YtpQ (UPF0354 family)